LVAGWIGRCSIAAKLWRTLNDPAKAAKAMSNAADNFAAAKNQQAIDYYKQALTLAQQAKDPALSAAILKAQGDFYQKAANNSAALTAYQQALEQAKLTPQPQSLQAQLLTNIGQIQQNNQLATEAINAYLQALPLWRQLGDTARERTIRSRLWLLYLATNRYEEALGITNQSVGLSSPQENATVKGAVEVQGLVMHPQFRKWQLDLLLKGDEKQVTNVRVGTKQTWGTLVRLDTTRYPNGEYLLRLRIVREDTNYDEYLLPITVSN
jgi:tetratricopeptide (TPR) repeat protein